MGSSRSAILWVAVALVVAAGLFAGGIALTHRVRPGAGAPEASAGTAADERRAAPPDERAALRDKREKLVAEALRLAPQLNRAGAEMLVADAERRGVPYGDVRDWSLLLANRGFAQLDPEDVKELGALFDQVYSVFSPADRAMVMAYVERLRRGETGSVTDERPRLLLQEGIARLPGPAVSRLQALFEASIAATLQVEHVTARRKPIIAASEPPLAARSSQNTTRNEEAYNRTREAQEAQATQAEEQEMRARAEQYKWQLASAERSVRYAQAEVQSAQEGLDAIFREVRSWDRPLGDPRVTAAERRLQSAKERYQSAKDALDELETRIRRERIPPGLLR